MLGDPTSDDPRWIRGAGGRSFVLDLERLEPCCAKPENLIGDRAYDSDPLDEECARTASR